jgi:hypothetical protein
MGPKKPKKTKEQLEEERLAKEEEDRKIKAAEEKKIAEEMEKRRVEELRIKAEHRKKREAELSRLNDEYVSVMDDLKSKELQLMAEEKQENAASEWLRYKEPTDEPNASVERDMNTFIALTNETYLEDLQPTLSLIKNVERIALAVEDVWSKSLATGNNSMRIKALDNLHSLKKIILEKLDVATMKLLRFSDSHLNDRSEMNIEETADHLVLGIWASFADVRPIRKSVLFETIGMQIDIQKQLLQNPHENYVFRVIRLPIVTYNFEAYDIPSEIKIVDEASADHDEEVENNASPTATGASSDTDRDHYPSKYVVGDLFIFELLNTMESPFYLRARKWTMRDNSSSSTKLRKVASYPSSVPCRVQMKVPDNLVMSEDTRIAVWDDVAKDWTEDGVSEFTYTESNRQAQFYITTIGILALVKPRTSCFPYSSWSLAPVLTKSVNTLLQLRQANKGAREEHERKIESAIQNKAHRLAQQAAAIREFEEMQELKAAVGGDIESKTPEKPSFADEPEIIIPDEFVDITVYDLIPEPSTSKELYERYARLVIKTASNHEITLDVVGSRCKLIVNSDQPHFADLNDKLFHPGCLLTKLQKKGINLLPTSFDLNAVKITRPKVTTISNDEYYMSECVCLCYSIDLPSPHLQQDYTNNDYRMHHHTCSAIYLWQIKVVEETVLKEIARASNSFEFTNSAWNQQLNQFQVGVLARETTIYTCLHESNEYDCVLVEADEASLSYLNTPELGLTPGVAALKYLCVIGNDYGNKLKFSLQPRPEEITHLTLRSTLNRRATVEAVERSDRTKQRFQKTVHTLLKLISPYSLS